MDQLTVLVSFAIYLAFFGWLGWRRGAKRETIVTITAILTWLLLQERGDVLVRLANLGGSAIAFARAGGLSGSQSDALTAVTTAPAFISGTGEQSFLFVVWVAVFVFTYGITHGAISDKNSQSNGWAIALGMVNGLFFAIAFLPTMLALFAPDGDLPQPGEQIPLLSIFGAGADLLWNSLNSLWDLFAPLGNLALLILLTLVLVLAATTIKGGSRAKSDSR